VRCNTIMKTKHIVKSIPNPSFFSKNYLIQRLSLFFCLTAALSCLNEANSACSTLSLKGATVKFVNNTEKSVKVNLVNILCFEENKMTLAPGQTYTQNTLVNYVWRFRDATTNTQISEVKITSAAMTVAVAPDIGVNLASLKGISPPSVPGLLSFDSSRPEIVTPVVTSKAAAIALGKALFWDQALGSDGIACASCHYQAGADIRFKNQINPGFSHNNFTFDTTRSGSVSGPNYTLKLSDFPFVPTNDDVVSANGVFERNNFRAGDPDSLFDTCDPVATTAFKVNGINVRQAEPRNSPTTINAAYNFRNFWDGRANNIFNGVSPFGMRDKAAGVFINSTGGVIKRPLNLKNSSLASQAVGPIMSILEMACNQRTFADVGRKVLNRRPLANQAISSQDSVLKDLPLYVGSTGTYTDLVRAAFNSSYWNSTANFSGYNQMEANFPMFFGLAVQLYEATLISDDTKFDRWKQGTTSLTSQESQGHSIFNGKGNCSSCHGGPVFTSAALLTNKKQLIERMTMKDNLTSIYDEGFYNIGVVPNSYDIGLGGKDPFSNPLSFSKQYVSGIWVDPFKSDISACKFEEPIYPNCSSPANLSAERVAVDGSFKVPTLRNIDLTGPYMHNGSLATLEQVVDFYNQGGNFDNVGKHPDIKPLGLSSTEKAALVAFLKTLTDDRVAYERAPFDHPSLVVPNGHHGDQNSVTAGNEVDPSLAIDNFINVSAVGSSGSSFKLKPFHEQLPTTTPLKVTVYRDANYSGISQAFDVGNYYGSTRGQMSIVGNNTISSISVPSGYYVKACIDEPTLLFGLFNICKTYTANTATLDTSMDNKISYIEIRKL
jgi:cytochrome c peroxidase